MLLFINTESDGRIRIQIEQRSSLASTHIRMSPEAGRLHMDVDKELAAVMNELVDAKTYTNLAFLQMHSHERGEL